MSECKELDDWGSCEKGYGILIRVTASVIRHVKLMNIWTLKADHAKNI